MKWSGQNNTCLPRPSDAKANHNSSVNIRPFLIRCVEAGALLLLGYILLLLSTGSGQIGLVTLQQRPVTLLLIAFFSLLLIRILLKHGSISGVAFYLSAGTALSCCVMIAYLSNGRTIGSMDTVPARYLPVSILRGGNFYLDQFPDLYSKNKPKSIVKVGDHYVSNVQIGAPVLALPFYIPTAFGSVRLNDDLLGTVEKIAASCLTALSVVVLFFGLLYLTDRKTAFYLSLVYALCTGSFSISSQALWQHGPSQLAIASAIYCLLRGREQPQWIGYAGFPLALSMVCRPTDIVFAVVLGIYVLLNHRPQFFRFLLFSFPPALFQLWYNVAYFHDPLHTEFPVERGWTTPWGEGILRSLFSPAKGLFIYSPVFLFSIVGMIVSWRRNNRLLRYLTIATVTLVLLYGRWRGAGGSAWGPRLLTDLAPILTIFLVPTADFIKRKFWKILFVLFCGWSVLVHALGAFAFDIHWYDYYRIREHPERLWMVRNNPIFFTSRGLWNRCVLHVMKPPTSRTAPDQLAAVYRTDLPKQIHAAPGREVRIRIEAVNDGGAVWLAEGEYGAGKVVLLGLWSKEDEPVRGMAVGDKLLFDVFPGESSIFDFYARVPSEPGIYTFRVGLVSQRVATFSKLGSTNLEFTIHVGGRSH